MTRKSDARETILGAAEKVVTQFGAAHLTLDAVAERAGISKGGLLYHFPSKEALVQGMIARLLQHVDADETRFKAGLGDAPGADLQAHLLAGFERHPEDQKVSAALLAAGATDPKLLAPVRDWNQRRYHALVKAQHHPVRAAIIMLAIDGIWLNELLETLTLSPHERKELKQELIELAKSAA